MSNNDLYCSKCKSHHHPVDCPLDESQGAKTMSKKERVGEIIYEDCVHTREEEFNKTCEVCNKKIAKIEAVYRVDEKEIAKKLTSMLESHDTDGDIELVNPDLDWNILGEWYAKAIAQYCNE